MTAVTPVTTVTGLRIVLSYARGRETINGKKRHTRHTRHKGVLPHGREGVTSVTHLAVFLRSTRARPMFHMKQQRRESGCLTTSIGLQRTRM